MTNDSLAQSENSLRWEYMTIRVGTQNWLGMHDLNGDEFNAKLNELGDQGWEMVSLISLHQYGTTNQFVAVFKRPR